MFVIVQELPLTKWGKLILKKLVISRYRNESLATISNSMQVESRLCISRSLLLG